MHCRLEAARLAWAKFGQPRLATAKVGQHIAKLNNGALEWEREQKNPPKNKPEHVSFIEQKTKCSAKNSVASKRCHEFYQSGAMNSALSGAMNAAMASHAVPWLMQPRLMISEAVRLWLMQPWQMAVPLCLRGRAPSGTRGW